MPRGGTRIGAGRKKGDKHLVRLWVTIEEEAALKRYLAKMRIANKSEADILADLEKKGQGKLFENTAAKTKKKVVVLQENNGTTSCREWSMQLQKNINNALKVSKKAARAILATEVCNTLNKPYWDRQEGILDVLRGFVDWLRDKRKTQQNIEDTNEILEVFLLQNGYVNSFDIYTLKRCWKKIEL